MIRCKFMCVSIKPIAYSDPPTSIVRLEARYSPEVPEDQRFTKYTPSGTLEVTIAHPVAIEQLQVGDQYYLNLERVPQE